MRHTASVSCFVALMLVAASAGATATVGSRAPEIGLSDLGGHRITIAGLRRQVVLVDIWATWCSPCEREMPVLERWYSTFGAEGFTVVGAAQGATDPQVRAFVSRLHVTFPIVHDPSSVLGARWGAPTMPSSYLVDRRGLVRYAHRGFRARDVPVIEAEIRTLLAEAP